MKAALAYLRRATVPGGFSDSLDDFTAYESQMAPANRTFDGRVFRECWPPYPNTGRNKLVKDFLTKTTNEVRVLLMVDDDMGFEPWQPAEIVECCSEERPVVSGLYFAYDAKFQRPSRRVLGEAPPATKARSPLRPIIMLRRPDGGYELMWRYPVGFVECDAVGMGFCAIHRSVLEEWAAKHGETWFDYSTRPDGSFALEDESFCVRMQSLGKKIFVQTQISLQHWKLAPFGEQHYVPPAE